MPATEERVRAIPSRSVIPSSSASTKWSRNASMPCGRNTPNSNSSPRRRLTSAVRSSTKPLRIWCSTSTVLLVGSVPRNAYGDDSPLHRWLPRPAGRSSRAFRLCGTPRRTVGRTVGRSGGLRGRARVAFGPSSGPRYRLPWPPGRARAWRTHSRNFCLGIAFLTATRSIESTPCTTIGSWRGRRRYE
jgi:hypothetical protein